MALAPAKTIFDVITDFLAKSPTPQEIVDYQIPDDIKSRALYLLERNGEGELSSEEESEMHDFIRADDMMSLLKTKMLVRLSGKTE